MPAPLITPTLPSGIRSRFVEGVNGLDVHVLEAGYEEQGRPCLLLLHGFPELAYSWRKVMVPLASAGFHVVAPDQRGYGRTTGWDGDYDGDLSAFRMVNLVRDVLGLLSALGHRSAASVIGHDFGSPVAAWCSLIRPDVFRSVVLMSAPFAGAPQIPFDTNARTPKPVSNAPSIHDELARLDPPRKHYHWYYSTRSADDDMRNAAQGLHAFLRAYYHVKSADWAGNEPAPLTAWVATELARLPSYYVMELARTMAESVAPFMPTAAEIAGCEWLTEEELAVYSDEYARTGFQGGLNWYRVRTSGRFDADQEVFSGRTIDVPATFIAGASDWGSYQAPGALERMESHACTRWLGTQFVAGAGHWVQQEQPEATTRLLLEFLGAAGQLPPQAATYRTPSPAGKTTRPPPDSN